MIHLAKSPHAAVLTTWCGVAERVSKNAMLGAELFARDGNRIARYGAFDCLGCRARVEAMARDSAKILSALPVERPTIKGCSDNSCPIAFPPGGLGTNATCRCDAHTLRMGASALRRHVLQLEARIGGAP